jgi:exonuclease SbcD
MSHALVNDATVGVGGGERALHLAMGIYGIRRERFPKSAQYVALGHLHKAQELVKSPPAWYSGSLLQLDFGEVEQEKSVNLIEVHAREPARVRRLSIDKGVRRLVDIGTPFKGVGLNELAALKDEAGDAWLRVYIDLDLPVANLSAIVRETLPNAVHVERVRPLTAGEPETGSVRVGAPEDMFASFYRSSGGAGREPSPATLALFRRLIEQEADATAEN